MRGTPASPPAGGRWGKIKTGAKGTKGTNVLSRGGGPRIELICVGSELLMGKLNTHGAYLSTVLEEAGTPLARETTVADDPADMAEVFAAAWRRSDVVLCAGGLGPTFDDVTRDVWARVLRRRLRFRPELLKTIRARFRRRGIPMPPANRRQAYLLSGARPLANEVGTAPGQRLDAGEKTLFLFPGPGSELKPMVARDLAPFLSGRGAPARRTRVWRLIGRPESAVDQRLRALFEGPGVAGTTWGILAHDGVVDVKITAVGATATGVEKSLAFWDGVLRREFGPDLFSEGAQSLAGALVSLLAERGETLALAESCTGGLAAKQLPDVPGSSRVFWGGVVAYDNRAKMKILGVPATLLKRSGAVSAAVARAMADGLRRRAAVDHALSVTGLAGPSGGTKRKPVGLVHAAWATRDHVRHWKKKFIGTRTEIRERAARWVLDALRRGLI